MGGQCLCGRRGAWSATPRVHPSARAQRRQVISSSLCRWSVCVGAGAAMIAFPPPVSARRDAAAVPPQEQNRISSIYLICLHRNGIAPSPPPPQAVEKDQRMSDGGGVHLSRRVCQILCPPDEHGHVRTVMGGEEQSCRRTKRRAAACR